MKYIHINKDLCNGCLLCLKECPTQAIRIRKGKATVEGVCINCARCIEVCPNRAISPVIYDDIEPDKRYIVCPSTILYSQFGENILPNDILVGLEKLGLGYVMDLAYINEVYNYATQLYIMEKRKEHPPPFPIISNFCPVVVRLIEYRFPSLIKHLLPIATPQEIFAREAKKIISKKEGIPIEDLNIIYITPCPAFMLYLESGKTKDKLIGINSIYKKLKKSIDSLSRKDKEKILHHSGGIGIAWGISGGEVAGLKAKSIAISGVCDTICHLEKIEMGLMKDIEYIEFRMCGEGCIGGPFTVEDKYVSKSLLQKFLWMFEPQRKIDHASVEKLYKKGWFKPSRSYSPVKDALSGLSMFERLEREKKIQEILEKLPNIACGLCGAPDCRAFAEDVVDGKITMEECRWLQRMKQEEKKNES